MTLKIYDMENRFIWNRLTICLLLFLALFPVVRANASDTADSVYFHIKLDTIGGAPYRASATADLCVGQLRI